MALYEEVRPRPKFGEWDVNVLALAEGFRDQPNTLCTKKLVKKKITPQPRKLHRYIDQFSRCLYVEYKKSGIDVQRQVPLYVATKMASIKKSSFFVPSAHGYARADLQWIGYEPRCAPYLPHSLLWRVAQ